MIRVHHVASLKGFTSPLLFFFAWASASGLWTVLSNQVNMCCFPLWKLQIGHPQALNQFQPWCMCVWVWVGEDLFLWGPPCQPYSVLEQEAS